jgi:zinc transport system permease protein
VAAAQQIASSFRATFYGAIALGVAVTTLGLVIAFYTDQFPAATIVLLSIGLFIVSSGIRLVRRG